MTSLLDVVTVPHMPESHDNDAHKDWSNHRMEAPQPTAASSAASSVSTPTTTPQHHLTRHSDMTVLISNRVGSSYGTLSSQSNHHPSPPVSLRLNEKPPLVDNNTAKTRRSIFGLQIQKALAQQRASAAHWHQTETANTSNNNDQDSVLYQIEVSPETHQLSGLTPPGSPVSGTQLFVPHQDSLQPPRATTGRRRNYQSMDSISSHPPESSQFLPWLSPMTTPGGGSLHQRKIRQVHHHKRPHETIHAQSLLLGLAFAAVWSPSNLMAPNLTEIAQNFGFSQAQRDLYLGSYCALATGVLSFPIAAGIGILADLVPRQRLFVLTVAGGALTSMATAVCTQYWQLFLVRLVNGGFMSGSVPVAFSFLGDLFATEERNAASSGLTAMMGLGIILGQVYAGTVGPQVGWEHAFVVSGIVTLVLAALCACLVQEPVRGGKEKVLQDMLKAGTTYKRKLTWSGFCHAVRHNESNFILLWQGFFSSLPWGIIFVFLNDYLSQERGFSIPDATYLVLIFGLGCAAGGVLGGYWGQVVQAIDRSYLPLFMSATTAAGILPFMALLNTHFTNARGWWGVILSFSGGLIASLPAVNVRPCLINVNPPETRGASLTAANLLINLGRGVGPSCVTVMGSIWHVSRQCAFNVTLVLFWLISAFQLLLLAKTLPKDQDSMEAELAQYAKSALASCQESDHDTIAAETMAGIESVVSIEDRITSFDGVAAKQTIAYMSQGFKEFRQEVAGMNPFHCDTLPDSSSEEEEDDDRSNGEAPRLPQLQPCRQEPLTEQTRLV